MARLAALNVLVDQPRVRDFFESALLHDGLSHAYLFTGAPGSGMEEAARALAQCIVCPEGGCGSCSECIRVAHGTHPDVHQFAPESVTGYLIEQTRNIIDDAALAPVRANSKVYILERAELLRGASANALLKTIEEPPAGVTFIMLARSADSCLPTIVSRCQQVPFRTVDPQAALAALTAEAAVSRDEARIALAVAGTARAARDYLATPARREARRLVVRSLLELAEDDCYDVVVAARQLVLAAQAPLDAVRELQSDELERSEEYLSRGALNKLKDAQKRKLTARERSGIMELLAASRSVLRDLLSLVEATSEELVNVDQAERLHALAARLSSAQVVHALEAVVHTDDDLAHNVSPELALEVMLFSIREAFVCPPSFR